MAPRAEWNLVKGWMSATFQASFGGAFWVTAGKMIHRPAVREGHLGRILRSGTQGAFYRFILEGGPKQESGDAAVAPPKQALPSYLAFRTNACERWHEANSLNVIGRHLIACVHLPSSSAKDRRVAMVTEAFLLKHPWSWQHGFNKASFTSPILQSPLGILALLARSKRCVLLMLLDTTVVCASLLLTHGFPTW